MKKKESTEQTEITEQTKKYTLVKFLIPSVSLFPFVP